MAFWITILIIVIVLFISYKKLSGSPVPPLAMRTHATALVAYINAAASEADQTKKRLLITGALYTLFVKIDDILAMGRRTEGVTVTYTQNGVTKKMALETFGDKAALEIRKLMNSLPPAQKSQAEEDMRIITEQKDAIPARISDNFNLEIALKLSRTVYDKVLF